MTVYLPGGIGQAETAVAGRNGVVRSAENGEIAVHPGMNIALHGDKFRLLVFRLNRRGAWRLRFIPFLIDFRQRMNVVRDLIVIYDFKRLVRLHDGDMGDVLAALLIVFHGLRAGSRSLIAGGDVDDDVLRAFPGAGHNVFGCDWRGVLFRARRFLRHVNRLHLWRSAGVSDLTGDGARGRRRRSCHEHCG